MNFDTRPYLPRDLLYIREIYLASRTVAFTWESPQGYQLEDFDRATKDEVIWVAAVGDRPVGFIAWWAPQNFVHHLCVDPHFTRRGIGSALLKRCLAQVDRPVSLKCVQRNTAAISFYVSQGWRIATTDHSPEGAYYLMVFDQS